MVLIVNLYELQDCEATRTDEQRFTITLPEERNLKHDPKIEMAGPSARRSPTRFTFVLCEGFCLMDLAIATSALSAANRIAGEPRYDWATASPDGRDVTCSNGVVFPVDAALADVPRGTRAFVMAFDRPFRPVAPDMLSWLRTVARQGRIIGAFGTGAVVLAKAGLLSGRKFTIHWTAHATYSEIDSDRRPQSTLFAIDGRVFTSAGGQSSADMMIAILSRDVNEAFGARVADILLGPTPRPANTPQRQARAVRFGTRNPHFLAIMDAIEADEACEITIGDLLEQQGVSRRQVERLFKKYCNTSPGRYLKDLRLDRARDLLDQTNMSVIDISTAVGFSTASYFSKSFALRFGCTPSRYRT